MKTFFIIVFSIALISCGGNADNISVGSNAPDFTLEDHNNNKFTLSEYEGKSPVIVYFYPKASTPGCTKQACGIRDEYSRFAEKGIIVLGISVDSKEEIKEFVEEYTLNFPLLSDSSKEVSEKYGVLNNLGKASRVTFVIDKNGKIDTIIRDVDVDTHSNEVFEIAKRLI